MRIRIDARSAVAGGSRGKCRRFRPATALFVAAAIVAGAAWTTCAQAPTYNPLADLPAAAGMYIKARYYGEPILRYGNWYGPGYWGGGTDSDKPGSKAPVDALDAIAQRHDFAYQIAEEQGERLGKAEEERLKAIADSIAVREAKRLNSDPHKWNPPAFDPTTAAHYRERIIFGFSYLAPGRKVKSLGHRLLDDPMSTDAILTTNYDEAALQAEVDKRIDTWNNEVRVQGAFSLVFVKNHETVPEGGSTSFYLQAIPDSPDATWDAQATRDVDISVDKGPGTLSRGRQTLEYPVELEAHSRLGGWWSTEGDTITVTARPAEDLSKARMIIYPATTTFTVGRATTLELTATPGVLADWTPTDDSEGAPCRQVTFRATLTDKDGSPISDQPIWFGDGARLSGSSVTDDTGVARWAATMCEDLLDGGTFHEITMHARYDGHRSGTPIRAGSSAQTILRLEAQGMTSVRGRVVDQLNDNLPIGGATVVIQGPHDSKTVETDRDGAFSAPFDLPVSPQQRSEVELTFSVSARGYADRQETSNAAQAHHAIFLWPLEAVITGTVRDAATQEPIDQARVRLITEFAEETAETGSDGTYRIEGAFFFDEATLQATGWGYSGYRKRFTVASETPTVDFGLRYGETALSGRVTIGPFKPVAEAGATVTLVCTSGTFTTTTGEDGRFGFAEAPLGESVTVTVETDEFGSHSKTVQMDVSNKTVDFKIGVPNYVVLLWSSPADPGPGQGVTVTAQLWPGFMGLYVELSVSGTDGYRNSVTTHTDVMGRAYLYVPGAKKGVLDQVTVRLIHEDIVKHLTYRF